MDGHHHFNAVVCCRDCGAQFEYSSFYPPPVDGPECNACKFERRHLEFLRMDEEVRSTSVIILYIAGVIILGCVGLLVLMAKTCVTDLYLR